VNRLVLAAVVVLVYGFMIVEARRAAANEAAQRRRGGVEPNGDVYGWMQIAYPGVFAAMMIEGAIREPVPVAAAILGVAIVAAGKALKWWAILTLGRYWTFRVLVVPGTRPISSGPYRYLRHPNYVGVIGELLGVAMLAGARISGPLAIVLFGALLRRRIAVEDRARDAILPRT
jgi:methyltransferase